MIVQCSACRGLVEIGEVRFDAGAGKVGLRCPECDATTWLTVAGGEVDAPLEATEPASRKPPQHRPEPAPTRATAPTATASALSSFDIEAITRALPDQSDLEASVKEAFSRHLRESWTDEAAHKRMVQRAALDDALAMVGQCYRMVLERSPDEPMAKRGQELVLAQAMAQLDRFDRDVPAARPGRGIMLFMVAAFVVGALAFLVRSLSSVSAP